MGPGSARRVLAGALVTAAMCAPLALAAVRRSAARARRIAAAGDPVAPFLEAPCERVPAPAVDRT